MQKVVKLYIKDVKDREYSSACFNIEYNNENSLFWFLFNIYRTVWGAMIVDCIYLNEPIFTEDGELDYEIPLACYDEFEKPFGLTDVNYYIKGDMISDDFVEVIKLYKSQPERFKETSGFTMSNRYNINKFIHLEKMGKFLTLTMTDLEVTCPIDMFQEMILGFGG